ncbi:MAG: hypothetical protein WC526_02440 [Patescibacteria group bacterium]
MFPPHLPPKSSSISSHKRWQRIKMLLGMVALCVFVGLCGAAIMVGWIWPNYGAGDIWISSYTRPAISSIQLDTRIRDEISLRIVAVYKSEASLSGINYLRQPLGSAVMVGSDGWAAMYLPDYDGNFKGMSVLTQNGQVYQFENGLLDKYSGVVYLKIKGGQFEVVNFSSSISANDEVFAFNNNNWNPAYVKYGITGDYGLPHLDSAPYLTYLLDTNFQAGSIIIDAQGRVAGFIRKDSTLLPSSYITRVLARVLSQQLVSYPSLGVEGWYSDEQPIVVGSASVKGFGVTRVLSAESVLKKGDIILTINGRVADPANLWYTVSNNSTARLQVSRAGKTINLETKIFEIK